MLVGVVATSAAGIVFEIALTRVFAIAQFYHFAYLAVSLALLGFGASGSALYAFPRLGSGGPRRWAGLAVGQSLATIGAYCMANWLPFDSFAIAWDRVQIFYLVVYYLALAVPFFFGGLIIAVFLAGRGLDRPVPSHRVYAASLSGSGAGAALALVGIDRLGGEATIVLSAAMAMIGALSFAGITGGAHRPRAATATAATGLLALGLIMPAPLQLNLSPYKDLSAALRYPGAEVTASAWDRGTRIDLVRSEGIRSVPGLSFTHSGIPPRQDGVTFDGDDLSAVPRFDVGQAGFTSHVLSSVVYRLRPLARALVLAPRGGLELAIALSEGAGSVVAVEPHAVAVNMIESNGPSVYGDPRVETIDQDPRAFIGDSEEHFDIVDLALTAPYRPVSSGAYSLSEDYLLTVEAFDQYLDRLAPGGLFIAMRWIQTPPSEETRLLAIAVEALRSRGDDPAATVIVLRSYSNTVLLVAPDGFTERDLEVIDGFVRNESFDIVFAPNRAATNLFNVLPVDRYAPLAASLVAATDLDPVFRAHDFEISAPTDDRPFFGHFFKWSQASAVLDTMGRTWQPFGGAGYFVLIALLGVAVVAALMLITAPLLVRRTRRIRAAAVVRWWTLGYFGLLGIAFMFVEIPLIQQYILLVGRPATAFTVVLASILVGSGVGSAWSPRIPWVPAGTLLTLVVLAYPIAVGAITPIALPAPSAARMLVAAAMVLPLGVLMGVMFPRGLAHIEVHDPQLVPWAWAVNGTVSVISAILAAILALSFGFSLVLQAGAVAYGLAALMAGRRPLNSPPG
jgi:hypothetical protein